MDKLVRRAALAAALLASSAAGAVECRAQEPAQAQPEPQPRWAHVSGDQLGTLRWWRDGVVTEENGTRVAWLQIEHRHARSHGQSGGGFSPQYTVEEHRFRFDCQGRKVQPLEGRERMNGEIVHEHAAPADAEWKAPYMFGRALEAIFRRVC